MRKNLRRRLLHPQKPLGALNRRHAAVRTSQSAVRSPQSALRIRPATLKDYDGLSEVFREADLLHSTALPGLFRPVPGPARSREYVAEIINSENSVVFVAEQDGKLVGAVHAEVHEAPTIPVVTPRRFAVIDTLVVTKPHRRKGVGTALAGEVGRWASQKSVSSIELTVYEFNRAALAFYQKLGYRTASRRFRKSLG
jgi:ribosomal protein S18 acetylase RimI-like enzyme